MINSRLYGGEEAIDASWAFLAHIELKYSTNIRIDDQQYPYTFNKTCSGTLIDRRTILTSANW